MITKQEALTANMFCHIRHRNSDGTALRARRNGKTQTWVRRPDDFSIPVKHGLKTSFRIESACCLDWLTFDITEVKDMPTIKDFVPREELAEWCSHVKDGVTTIGPFSDWCEEISWQAMANWLRAHAYVFHSSMKEWYLKQIQGYTYWTETEYKMIAEEFLVNLDDMSVDSNDYRTYAIKIGEQDGLDARELHTINCLAVYAEAKAMAMDLRGKGFINLALILERACEALYCQLPMNVRW